MQTIMTSLRVFTALTALTLFTGVDSAAQDGPTRVLFTNVNVFDGVSDQLQNSMNVLVEGNLIAEVSESSISAAGATVIDGGGRTLMPGLSDAHAHITMVRDPLTLMNDLHWAYTGALIAREAERMLLRGFTTIRDLGGPSYGIAQAIDAGEVPGPRIFPSGQLIGQTSGHGDFRSYNDPHPRDRASRSNSELQWSFLADGADEVRVRAREVLRLGATQIKVMVGGGASSPYDPLDVTLYTVEEIRAAVEAAEGFGTYVTVHSYHDESVRNALEAGVKSIDHGTLITSGETMEMMNEMGAIYTPQAFIFSPTEEQIAAADPATVAKGAPLRENLDTSMRLARDHGVKIGFGVDSFGSAELLAFQNLEFGRRLRWFSSVEILRQATSVNAELFALSGARSPYQEGPLGVVQVGAYADLLLVEGDPTQDVTILEDYENNLRIIMKDGVIYKNTLGM